MKKLKTKLCITVWLLVNFFLGKKNSRNPDGICMNQLAFTSNILLPLRLIKLKSAHIIWNDVKRQSPFRATVGCTAVSKSARVMENATFSDWLHLKLIIGYCITRNSFPGRVSDIINHRDGMNRGKCRGRIVEVGAPVAGKKLVHHCYVLIMKVPLSCQQIRNLTSEVNSSLFRIGCW